MSGVIYEVGPGDTKDELSESQYIPRLFLDISKEQLDLLDGNMDKTVVFHITGKVVGLSSDSFRDDFHSEVTLEIKKVVVDPQENEFTKLAEDD